jgi:type II restriction enzyme
VDLLRLIDVLWLNKAATDIAAAFEVEHSTSIYSGIMRMLDLALGTTCESVKGMFLVAPDNRKGVSDLQIRYLSYRELEKHRESIARFGEGLKAFHSISKILM